MKGQTNNNSNILSLIIKFSFKGPTAKYLTHQFTAHQTTDSINIKSIKKKDSNLQSRWSLNEKCTFSMRQSEKLQVAENTMGASNDSSSFQVSAVKRAVQSWKFWHTHTPQTAQLCGPVCYRPSPAVRRQLNRWVNNFLLLLFCC